MKLVFHAAALTDLRSIYDYLKEENPAVAVSVIARIKISLERLTTFPKSGRTGVVSETYEIVVSGLPYIVVYKLTDTLVEIIAVFHSAQNRSNS